MHDSDPSWVTYIAALSGVGAFLTAAAIPLTAFYRRPSLTLREDKLGLHSHVEAGGYPYVRVLVQNKRWRRTAHEARVFVTRYEQNGNPSTARTLGSPPLGWTSLSTAGTGIVFSRGERPVDLGTMLPLYTGIYDEPMPPPENEEASATIRKKGQWWFRLALHNLEILDGRQYLRPTSNGYIIQLDLGAEDGPARSYDVHLNWDGTASDGAAALASVQLEVIQPSRRLLARLRS